MEVYMHISLFLPWFWRWGEMWRGMVASQKHLRVRFYLVHFFFRFSYLPRARGITSPPFSIRLKDTSDFLGLLVCSSGDIIVMHCGVRNLNASRFR